MSNKIIFQAETDHVDLSGCVQRMYEVIYFYSEKEPIGSEYIITVTRKEEE